MKNRPEDILPLPAKLLRPEPRNVYPRMSLFERIDAARRSPVVWLSAPAGAGKTVLASSYLRERRLNHQWYQVDERDEDLASFFHYLGMAARQHAPHLAPLPALTSEYLAGLNVYSRRFFEGLYQRIRPPAMLVLDDYQEVAEAALLHEAVRLAAGLLPPGFNLMVVSRGEPPPCLARLRLHGDLTVLGWGELRLSFEEARGIAQQRQGDATSLEWVAHCHERADGWTAGLILLLEGQRQEGQATTQFNAAGRDRLFEYFAGEMLEKSDPISRNVLLKTALLPRTTGDWAVRLTGIPEAEDVLEALHRRNFFLLKRDKGETVYEYHPLFRDFLREWARRQAGTDGMRESLTRAAEILAESQQYEEAAELYREAANHDGLVRLLMKQAGTLMTQGRHLTLQAWLDALPEHRVQSDAWLLYWQGMACFPVDPTAARGWFERAFARFEEMDDPAGLYVVWAAIIETYQAGWGNFTSIDVWLATFQRLRSRHPEFPSQMIEMRVVGMLVGQLYRNPDDPCLHAWARRGLELLASAEGPTEAIVLVSFLGNYCSWTGDLRTGIQVADSLQPHLHKATPHARLYWYAMRSALAWGLGDGRTALEWVIEGLNFADETGIHAWDFMILSVGVYGSLIDGDFTSAESYLHKLSRTLRATHLLESSHYDFLLALLSQQRGDLDNALIHGTMALDKAIETGCMFPEMLVRTILSLLLFLRADDDSAEKNLRSAEVFAGRMGSKALAYLCALTRAQVALEREQMQDLENCLRTALALAQEAGGPMLPYFGPKIMARLYAHALEAGIEVDYVRRIICKTGLTPPDDDCGLWPWKLKVYTLGRFTILRDDEPLSVQGKAQRKPLELLMALIALGGREVPTGELADALWPDSEGDAAYRSLITTLQRLRQLLDNPDAIALSGNHLSLNRKLLWVDCWAFERLLNRSEQAQRDGEHDTARKLCEKAMRLYHRPFLETTAEPWAHSRRERLSAKFRHRVLSHCEALESEGRQADAIACYLHALEADERAEVFYDHLTSLYRRLGRGADARAVAARRAKLLA